ncbi:FadR/GntR family transcriptional regulator [Kitasatospora purpeofusca]|uniref:FadR/GntR family transcriptional regulator n=1 Tax=Kitasatospora purpeofusca TaxID=67352 RepID=UPI00381E575F
MPLTDMAIARIRELIRAGALPPGSRLPPERQLAAELGLSRNPMREAVKALVVARVLEVRRGDGTYVTSLTPGVLLGNLAGTVELLTGDTLVELIETRRLLEPAATELAAARIDDAALAELARHLDAMRASRHSPEQFNLHDAAFHRTVAATTGNETLVTLLEGIAGRTLRARVRRGTVDGGAADRAVAEHEAIHRALAARDVPLARAAALMHVTTTENWLRTHLRRPEDGDRATTPAGTARVAP